MKWEYLDVAVETLSLFQYVPPHLYRFYILATKEFISVPLNLSAEMVPFSHLVGELRAHYAGFFDPGFGYGKEGETRGTIGMPLA